MLIIRRKTEIKLLGAVLYASSTPMWLQGDPRSFKGERLVYQTKAQ